MIKPLLPRATDISVKTPGKPAEVILEGHMVVLERGSQKGRVGMLTHLSIFSPCLVAYGSGGPTYECSYKDLRKATREEIKKAKLEGVGRR